FAGTWTRICFAAFERSRIRSPCFRPSPDPCRLHQVCPRGEAEVPCARDSLVASATAPAVARSSLRVGAMSVPQLLLPWFAVLVRWIRGRLPVASHRQRRLRTFLRNRQP